jgi:hypothetical protein
MTLALAKDPEQNVGISSIGIVAHKAEREWMELAPK